MSWPHGAGTGFAHINQALVEVMRAGLPDGMRGRLTVHQTFDDPAPYANIVLTCGDGSAEDRVRLEPHSPDQMVTAVREALPELINECWASGLSLPDTGFDREEDYRRANAMDSEAASPPTQGDKLHPGVVFRYEPCPFPTSHACRCSTCRGATWLS